MKLVRPAAAVSVVALLAQCTGCVPIYQPLRGLNTPLAIDWKVRNFAGTRLLVHCPPGEWPDRLSTDELCRKVGVVFENQGATVTTFTPEGGVEGGIGEVSETAAETTPETDLQLELRTRKIDQKHNPVMWVLSAISLTIIPASVEYTFAQDVVIRDGTGFLLAEETYQGRMVTQFGVTIWVGNAHLNLWRLPDDKLTEESLRKDLSDDLFGQLSQDVFNAKMQWLVLQQTPPASSRK